MLYKAHFYHHKLTAILSILVVVLCWRCANPVQLNGGLKDVAPPKIDSLHSTPNNQTNFSSKEIVFKFNEWIQVVDAPNQVLVSPPLKEKPQLKANGKSVVVQFSKKDTLRPNTTYVINFGSAIRDFHEGNVLKENSFVFSTGDYIDSLAINGSTFDALTGKTLNNVVAALYDIQSLDSTMLRGNPLYFAKSTETGTFSIKNLHSGSYKLVCFEDKNNNLKWEPANEMIGYTADNILLDSAYRQFNNVYLFKQNVALKLTSSDTKRFGVIKLNFNKSFHKELISLATSRDDIAIEHQSYQTDSLLLWYKMLNPDSSTIKQNWKLFITYQEEADAPMTHDTVEIRAFNSASLSNRKINVEQKIDKSSSGKRSNVAAASIASAPIVITQKVDVPVVINFDFPIKSLDTSLISFVEDTLNLSKNGVFEINANQLSVNHKWNDGKLYNLLFLPQAIKGTGDQLNDSIPVKINILQQRSLSDLQIDLKNIDSKKHYVLQLITNDRVINTYFIDNNSSLPLSIKGLAVQAYEIRLFQDDNNNGFWDTGDYWKKTQPEKVWTHKVESLKPNWEVMTEIDLKASKSGAKRN
ncbi:MAG: Ig-like domain-containing protein [Saprospiraceae bacterium]|nr:Ig-like domain-containing protein [Saprospiraceae bacterium]